MDLSIIACCGHPTNASRSSVFISLFKNLQLVELFLSNIGFFLANDTRPSPLQCESPSYCGGVDSWCWSPRIVKTAMELILIFNVFHAKLAQTRAFPFSLFPASSWEQLKWNESLEKIRLRFCSCLWCEPVMTSVPKNPGSGSLLSHDCKKSPS